MSHTPDRWSRMGLGPFVEDGFVVQRTTNIWDDEELGTTVFQQAKSLDVNHVVHAPMAPSMLSRFRGEYSVQFIHITAVVLITVLWIALVVILPTNKQAAKDDDPLRDSDHVTSRQGNQDGESEEHPCAPDSSGNATEPPQAPSPRESSPSEASMDNHPDPPVPDLLSEPEISSPIRPDVVSFTAPEPVQSCEAMVPDVVQSTATLLPNNDHEELPTGICHNGVARSIRIVSPGRGDITLPVDASTFEESAREAFEVAAHIKAGELAFSHFGLNPTLASNWVMMRQQSKLEVRKIILVCCNNTNVPGINWNGSQVGSFIHFRRNLEDGSRCEGKNGKRCSDSKTLHKQNAGIRKICVPRIMIRAG